MSKLWDSYFDNVKFLLIFFVVFGYIFCFFINDNNFMFYFYKFIYIFYMFVFIFVFGYFVKGFKCVGYVKKLVVKLIILYLIF